MKVAKLALVSFLFTVSIHSQNYFPLEIGNKWFYEVHQQNSTNKTSLEVIGDTLMPNGIEYYILDKRIDPAGFLTEYIRVDTNYIYFYDELDSSDVPVYNFHALIDEPYRVGLHGSQLDSAIVEKVYEGTTELFGYQTEIMVFDLDTFVPFMLEFSDKFGPLGWSSAHHEPISQSLLGCIINGTQYGQTVDVNDDEFVQYDYKLMQNYPNPFNPKTTIEYTVARFTNVRITVYNITGEVLQILVDEVQSPGDYKVYFNGSAIPSGVYFYKMETKNYNETKKLLLLR